MNHLYLVSAPRDKKIKLIMTLKKNNMGIQFSFDYMPNLRIKNSYIDCFCKFDDDHLINLFEEDSDISFDDFLNMLLLSISLNNDIKIIMRPSNKILVDQKTKYITIVKMLRRRYSVFLHHYNKTHNINKNIVDKFQFLWDHLGI